MYLYYHEEDKVRGARFDSAMNNDYDEQLFRPIESIFDFGHLSPDALVVDVGGGKGHHAIRLAGKNPQMSFIVQDFQAKTPPMNHASSESTLERMKWQQHDFFTTQPVIGASLYLLSRIFMDHPNE
jgi:sterigmatocystin 8-O-methyltransferase